MIPPGLPAGKPFQAAGLGWILCLPPGRCRKIESLHSGEQKPSYISIFRGFESRRIPRGSVAKWYSSRPIFCCQAELCVCGEDAALKGIRRKAGLSSDRLGRGRNLKLSRLAAACAFRDTGEGGQKRRPENGGTGKNPISSGFQGPVLPEGF